MKDIKLKPCPFCGGEAKTVKHYQLDSPKSFWIAYCTKCQVRQYKGNINDGYLYQTETQAIEAWNTRKPMDRIVERLSKMEKKPTEWGIPYIDYEKAIEIVEEVSNG